MKKLFAIIGLIGLTSAAQPAQSAVSFSVFISNAPPPPRVVFVEQPRFVLVREEGVYYCDDDYSDYDVFRYGSYFYLYDDGYWYRANSYRGPFVAIRFEYVPQQIFFVSDYGYRWRQSPRWGSRSYSAWNTSDRRFRDWRYRDRRVAEPRYVNRDWREGGSRSSGTRYGDRSGSSGIRDWGTRDRRVIQPPTDDRRDRREVQAPAPRDDDRQWRDSRGQQNDNPGRGKAKGKGKGKGQGHGNGRDHDDD